MNFLLHVCEFRMTIRNRVEASAEGGGQRNASALPIRVLRKDAASI
jgi:hypothetical protein